MKKILVLICAMIVVAVCFVGCGKKSLDPSEFAIYVNGEVAITPEEMQEKASSYDLGFYFLHSNPLEAELENKVLETKRGIRLGDTIEDVARAYKDCVMRFSDYESLFDIKEEDFFTGAEYLEKEKREYDSVRIGAIVSNGRQLSEQECTDDLLGKTDREALQEKNRVQHYSIVFSFENGVISEIAPVLWDSSAQE